MMRTVLLILVLCISAAAASAAPEDRDTDCTEDVRPLVLDLVSWIAEHSPYDVSPDYTSPRIVFCAVGDSIPYEGRIIVVGPHLRAMLDIDKRQIVLVAPWSPANPRDVAVLLHELVHDLQFSSRRWPCIAATEWEAYTLQDRWLAEHGIDSGFNWSSIFMLSRCLRDVHSSAATGGHDATGALGGMPSP